MLRDQSPGLHPAPAPAGLILPETKLLIEEADCRGHLRSRRNEPKIESRQGSTLRRSADPPSGAGPHYTD